MEGKKQRCHNCKFSGTQFKIGKLTHCHCQNKELYPVEDFENGKFSAWDTLMVFNDSCDKHEFKNKVISKSI